MEQSSPSHDSQSSPSRRVPVACPQCHQGYKIAARLIGKRLVCRHCRHEWRASELSAAQLAELKAARQREEPSDSGSVNLPEALPAAGGSSSVAIDTSLIGKRIGRYQILSVLGHGGMGVVWRAHDDTLRRDVALKILNRKDKDSASPGGLNYDLFMQEARAVAKLQHPSVVAIFEVAEDSGAIFLSLELMEGGTLKEHVDHKGPLEPRKLFEMLVGPTKALGLAHRRGIIHRDVKPTNLMFDDHGHLQIMDFGLADVTNEEVSERLRGKAVGSLGWVSPETARGKQTTNQSDIYSLGLVMVYALTGKPPIHAKSRSQIIALHQNPPKITLDGITGLTPRGELLLRKCLAVDTKERFANADELAAALQECADEDPLAAKRHRKSRVSIALIASIFGVIIGIGASLYYVLGLMNKQEELTKPSVTVPYRPNAPASPASPEPRAAINVPVAATPPAPTSQPTVAGAISKEHVPWPEVMKIGDDKFIASERGKVYHKPTAQCSRKIFASNLVIFNSEKEAQQDGRTPCPQCLGTSDLTSNHKSDSSRE